MPVLVVTDQKRIDVAVGNVPADHELLTAISSPLDPIGRTFAGAILAAATFGNNAFEPMLSDGPDQLGRRHIEGL